MEFSGAKSKVLAVEIALAKLLRVGAVVAASLIAVGIGLLMFGMPGLASSVMTIGLVALVSTPVMRVAVAMLVFLKERDWLFASFCLVVLLSLAVGMLIGKAE